MPASTFRTIVGTENFEAWLKAYPRPLDRDVFRAAEPPLVTWNDFARAPYWPDSIVAKTSADSGVYEVLADINELVVTDREPDLARLFDANGNQVEVGDTIEIEWAVNISAEGPETRHTKRHVVHKRDVGTPYETWSPTDCANNLRNMTFVKISEA